MKVALVSLCAFVLAQLSSAQICPEATMEDLEVVVMIPLEAPFPEEQILPFDEAVAPITVEVAEDLDIVGTADVRNLREDRQLGQSCGQCMRRWPSRLCRRIGSCRRRMEEVEETASPHSFSRKLEHITDEERALAPAHEQRKLLTFSQTCSDARFDFLHRLEDEIDTATIPGAVDMIAAMEVHCYVHCSE